MATVKLELSAYRAELVRASMMDSVLHRQANALAEATDKPGGQPDVGDVKQAFDDVVQAAGQVASIGWSEIPEAAEPIPLEIDVVALDELSARGVRMVLSRLADLQSSGNYVVIRREVGELVEWLELREELPAPVEEPRVVVPVGEPVEDAEPADAEPKGGQ